MLSFIFARIFPTRFRKMLLYAFIFTVLLTPYSNAEECVNDTPTSNVTIGWDHYNGECIRIKADSVSENYKYEGRWYGLYLGYQANVVANIRCMVWDTFFDDQGNFHNFLWMMQEDTERVLVDIGRPIDAKRGLYHLNIGNDESQFNITATLFHVDDELFYWWEIQCVPNTKITKRNVAIGFRNLDDAPRKSGLIRRLTNDLKKQGGESERHRIDHTNCNYPPPMKNPYKKGGCLHKG